MNDKPATSEQRAAKSKEASRSHAPATGASRKTALLLAGAAALALLAGGGYYAWTNGAAPNEIASSDNASAPYAYDEVTAKEATPEKAVPAAALPEEKPATDSQAQKKPTRIAAAAIPEETLGVSRGPVRANQTDALVINARRPIWRYTPTPERLSEYYPEFALERGREGEARLHCMIGKKGKLDCERVSETPAKAGFGNAALRVAHTLRHADRRADGKSAIGTPINLRVVFRMPEAERRRG